MSEHNGTAIDSRIKYMADMQELYQFTERQFLEFDEIVPMRLNRKGDTVSPKLYFLLMTICGQVESVTGCICKSLDIRAKCDKFGVLYKKLCEEFGAINEQSVQTVMTRSTGQNNPLILTKNAGIHRTSSDIIRIALQFFKDV